MDRDQQQTYIQGLERLVKDMVNSLVHAQDPKPELFIVKYCLGRVSAEELQAAGIQVVPRRAEEAKTDVGAN
jgi:hypothetical protein